MVNGWQKTDCWL